MEIGFPKNKNELFKTLLKLEQRLVALEALYGLQQAKLETLYLEANKEIDNAFEIATADGLTEDWKN